jgi:hypothetical protein
LKEGEELRPTSDIAKTHFAARNQWSRLEKVAAWVDGRRQIGTVGVIGAETRSSRLPDSRQAAGCASFICAATGN